MFQRPFALSARANAPSPAVPGTAMMPGVPPRCTVSSATNAAVPGARPVRAGLIPAVAWSSVSTPQGGIQTMSLYCRTAHRSASCPRPELQPYSLTHCQILRRKESCSGLQLSSQRLWLLESFYIEPELLCHLGDCAVSHNYCGGLALKGNADPLLREFLTGDDDRLI